ncbi:hypothetical protein SLEP1_g47075 [Rubroshorea leprosula]|uniref:Uncharacterized protein n=1 Tax=Rubroshorea leprosula TaxID=152421 RepID=A0AAV5LR48_9ROSI|nr:hypothetical protein SLEP1_g47075 [Rubroshorea leprosula]
MAFARSTSMLMMLLLFTAWFFSAQASRQLSGGIAGAKKDIVETEVATAPTNGLDGGKKAEEDDSKLVKLEKVKVKGAEKKQSVSHFSDEADETGFVAFNVDYHGPTHHPPKNN